MKTRMKKLKSSIALMLAGMLLLSGCSSTETSNSESSKDTGGEVVQNSEVQAAGTGGGRYVETDINPADEIILDVLKGKDGELILYTDGMQSKYTSSDAGETWEKSQSITTGIEGEVYHMALMDNGDVLAVSGQDNQSDKIYRISKENTVTEINLPGFSDSDGVMKVMSMKVIAGSKLALSAFDSSGYGSDGGAATFAVGGDTTMNAVYDLETNEKVYDILVEYDMLGDIVSDDSNFYIAGNGSNISVHDINDGKKIRDIRGEEPDEEIMINISFDKLALSGDGVLYSQDKKGIHKRDMETGAKTEVIPGNLYLFGGNNVSVERFYSMGKEEFVAFCRTGMEGESSLVKYHFDANAKTDPEKTLKIWTLKDNPVLRTAVSSFLRANPDSNIELETAMQSESAQEIGDAIQSLNTRMLAGDGPDIIMLDETPMQSYAEKGMLMDLKGEVNVDEMYSHLTDEVDENMYYLPTRFKIPVLMANESMIEKLQTMDMTVEEIVKGNALPPPAMDQNDIFSAIDEADRPVLTFQTFDELFNLFWSTSAGELVKDNKIDSESLGHWIEEIKKVSDKFSLAEENSMQSGGIMVISGASGGGDAYTGGMLDYMYSRAAAAGTIMGDIMELKFTQKGDTKYVPFPGLAEGSYIPQVIMGVSSNSKNKDYAVKFIQNMLSDEAQSVSGGGFPVTSKGYDAQLDGIEKMEIQGEEFAEEISFDMEAFTKNLKTPVTAEDTIKEVIKNAALSYCKGAADLETALSDIESGTKTYLAEISG